MIVSEIYLWGAVLTACLLGVSMMVLAIADSKMLKRMLTIFIATVLQMAAVLAVVWFCYQTHSVWAYLLWYVLILLLSTCWCLYPLRTMWKKMVVPVGASTLAGSIVLAGSTLLMLPTSVYIMVYSVLMACLTASMIQTMLNFISNTHQPGAQKQELSWRERVLPQVRSMAQPLVMVMPTLYAGMLLGGIPALIGLMVILLLVSASFVANVLAGVIALSMIRKKAVEVQLKPESLLLKDVEADGDVRRLIHNMMELYEGTTIMNIVLECQREYQERYFSMQTNDWRHLIRDYVRKITERPELQETEIFRYVMAG